MMVTNENSLRLRRLDVDTHHQPIAVMRRDCHVCRAEGFNSQSRIQLKLNGVNVIATLDIVGNDWLEQSEVGVSESTWNLLHATDGDIVSITHPSPLESLAHVRAKIFRHTLDRAAFQAIIRNVAAGTADTIETLAPVTLDLPTIRRVVEREGGCIAWSGFVNLSPADDILIRVERALGFT